MAPNPDEQILDDTLEDAYQAELNVKNLGRAQNSIKKRQDIVMDKVEEQSQEDDIAIEESEHGLYSISDVSSRSG